VIPKMPHLSVKGLVVILKVDANGISKESETFHTDISMPSKHVLSRPG
jgi:hypothetical protein